MPTHTSANRKRKSMWKEAPP
ncbi:hypothetical protein EYF80_061120 [Liparis tanakae]|uniref:Uncharacterized protein n=1 Tax=Liparis tanakae TaxID=230148 RepID=A0A4Z2EK54_9TELE|nr:hypothetical protein EYF80_061120 [Liparis tanakae]